MRVFICNVDATVRNNREIDVMDWAMEMSDRNWQGDARICIGKTIRIAHRIGLREEDDLKLSHNINEGVACLRGITGPAYFQRH